MKKVKIMLMSMALIAVVGGALAFKAKYTQRYCTTLASPAGFCKDLACPNGPFSPSTTGSGSNVICTTIVPAGGCLGIQCADAPSVPALKID
ncbi:hypothetical protein A4H97_22930 [Niastella yeongjuensis]|uniref:Membrane or secreted protein n=1 Tax=Niastella yeongjuensis TaxID=354355 RepID=A0A1V9F7D5_9BACT|nr:hypothetical protein [Niastella yeongjuensis]OQP54340.1 hypothetical protein A4H97_22930 [Niastella yeongjuensis]SEP29879.1 hypothetical protein SAMN05660816_05121 [Niastella yeongjuensis]